MEEFGNILTQCEHHKCETRITSEFKVPKTRAEAFNTSSSSNIYNHNCYHCGKPCYFIGQCPLVKETRESKGTETVSMVTSKVESKTDMSHPVRFIATMGHGIFLSSCMSESDAVFPRVPKHRDTDPVLVPCELSGQKGTVHERFIPFVSEGRSYLPRNC